MFTVVATTFQQIMTELCGAESEEDRTMAITKIVLKLVNQNGRLSSWAVNMTALARVSSNCKEQARPLVRERAPYQQTRNYLPVKKSGLGLQMAA
jgi:hypothetical protein